MLGCCCFCLFLPIFVWNILLVCLIYLKISLVFPILSFLSIYLHWLLRNALFSLFAVLWNSAFSWVYLSLYPLPFASFPFSTVCKSPDNHFAFLHFFFLEMVLIISSCTMLWTSIHRFSGTLSTRSIPLNVFIAFIV